MPKAILNFSNDKIISGTVALISHPWRRAGAMEMLHLGPTSKKDLLPSYTRCGSSW